MSRDILDIDNDVLTNSSNCKLDFSSMIVNLSCVPDIYTVIESRYKSPNKIDLDGCPSKINVPIAQIQNILVKKEMPNYSFVDLDFDFANLHLFDVMQKEKCLVSQIINHLSSSLTSTISETSYSYKRNKQEESSIASSNSDTSFHVKGDTSAHYKYCQRKSKHFLYKMKNNLKNKNILKLSIPRTRRQYSKYNIQNSSKKKYKDISDKISLTSHRILDNSIISMSPNFNPSNHRKRRNICKTLLTPSNICNDSIISKSPNFTPISMKKRNLTKTSHMDDMKIFKKSSKYKTQMQGSEFSWYKKHIAQSTPRRKKRLICKFHSGRRKFDPYRYESDVTSDEFISNNILKPIDLDKTIFFETAEDTSLYDILDTSSELSLSNLKKRSKIKRENQYNNQELARKLDERCEENDITDNNNSVNLLNATSSFNQIAKENESVNNLSNNTKHVKSENNEINEFIIVRKNRFNIDKTLERSIDTNNIKSTCTTESDSLHKENFVNCVDCDTKKLLNEDLNMNISKTCNLHAKNWYSDRFHIFSSHKSSIKNDSLPATNLFIRCKKQIYLSDSQKSYFSRSTNSKKTESLLKAKDLNMYKAEDNS